MKSFASFQQIIQRITAVAGGLVACLTAVGTFQQWLEKPPLRWGAWAACAVFFAIAAVTTANRMSSLVDSQGIRLRVPGRGRKLFTVSACACLLVCLADVRLTLLGSPLHVRASENLLGTGYGYTPPGAENPLLSKNVKNLWPIKSEEDYRRDAFDGVYFQATAQRRTGIEYALIHECTVQVEKVEEMPLLVNAKHAAGIAEALEASFFIHKRSEPFPWRFHAEYVRSTQGSKTEEGKLPFVFSDDAPKAIRFCINAKDPGIYWISCSLLVSNGLGRMSTVKLTETAVPIAFYAAGTAPTIPLEELTDHERWMEVP